MTGYHLHLHFSPNTAEPVNHGGLGLDQACVDGHTWAPFREKNVTGLERQHVQAGTVEKGASAY